MDEEESLELDIIFGPSVHFEVEVEDVVKKEEKEDPLVDADSMRIELMAKKSIIGKLNSEVETLEQRLEDYENVENRSFSLLEISNANHHVEGTYEDPINLDSDEEDSNDVEAKSVSITEVKDEVLEEDYWKYNSRYIVDMTNANPQELYSDEECFDSNSPNLVASTPKIDDLAGNVNAEAVKESSRSQRTLFDSSSSSDHDDTGFCSQTDRKRKKDMRALGRSSQRLKVQTNTVTKTGESTVSARIEIDQEECFLDQNQQNAVMSIVNKFKSSKKNAASAKKKQNVLKAIADLLDEETVPEEVNIVANDHQIAPVDAFDVIGLGGPQTVVAGEDIQVHIPTIEEELANYKFNSDSVLLEQLRMELSSSQFARTSAGLRGLASLASVSNEEFMQLRSWEVPGLLFDFGHHFTLKEASRFLAEEEQQANILGITSSHYRLMQVNNFLERTHSSSFVPGGQSSAMLVDRRSIELGDVLYKFYSWVDPSIRCLGPNELDQFLDHSDLSFLKPNIAPWPATLFPKNPHDVKYYSVCRDGYEYVCRTMASRQYDLKFFSNSSEIFSCAICGDVISTPYHTYVNCYRYYKNAPFVLVMNWTKTFLRACYLHFKCEGSLLPGRDCHSDASIGDSSRGWLGRGGSRGRGGSGSSWRRGTPCASLFRF